MMSPSLRALSVLLLAASCGDGGGGGAPDAPAGAADAPLSLPDGAAALDAAPGVDGAVAANPARLWLAPINGSEINLQLQDHEPPPF